MRRGKGEVSLGFCPREGGGDLRAGISRSGVCYNFGCEHLCRRLAMTADQSRADPNRLYFGDNLEILREHVADESVDLIYLDPPFNSNATYNVLFRERSGEESAAQITAFEDTWHWGWESETAFQDVVMRGPEKVGNLLSALRQFLGQNDMMAYLGSRAALFKIPTFFWYRHRQDGEW